MYGNEQLPQIRNINQTTSQSTAYIESATPDLIKWQLSNEDTIDQLENDIRGIIWDPMLKKYICVRDPLMNDRGISAVISLLKPITSKTVILSNLPEQQIFTMSKHFSFRLTKLLAKRHCEFGIDKHMLTPIADMLEDVYFATLMRAKDGGEREFLSKAVERKEIISNDGERKRGIGNLFKF